MGEKREPEGEGDEGFKSRLGAKQSQFPKSISTVRSEIKEKQNKKRILVNQTLGSRKWKQKRDWEREKVPSMALNSKQKLWISEKEKEREIEEEREDLWKLERERERLLCVCFFKRWKDTKGFDWIQVWIEMNVSRWIEIWRSCCF